MIAHNLHQGSTEEGAGLGSEFNTTALLSSADTVQMHLHSGLLKRADHMAPPPASAGAVKRGEQLFGRRECLLRRGGEAVVGVGCYSL